MDGLIAGLKLALKEMPVGAKWDIYIPYEKAFGEKPLTNYEGDTILKPYSDLICTLELLSIKKK